MSHSAEVKKFLNTFAAKAELELFISVLKRRRFDHVGEGCPFGQASWNKTAMIYYSTSDEFEIPGLKRVVLDGESHQLNCSYGNKCKRSVHIFSKDFQRALGKSIVCFYIELDGN